MEQNIPESWEDEVQVLQALQNKTVRGYVGMYAGLSRRRSRFDSGTDCNLKNVSVDEVFLIKVKMKIVDCREQSYICGVRIVTGKQIGRAHV